MIYSTCIVTYYYCLVKTKTTNNHVLCGMIFNTSHESIRVLKVDHGCIFSDFLKI